MSDFDAPLAPETEDAAQKKDAPITVDGKRGEYVVMTLRVFDAMLGISDDEAAETLASVLRGINDMAEGRSQEAGTVFGALEARYAS